MEQSHRLKEFLEAADMVKYAGQRPDALQIDTSIARAKEFIDMKPLVTDVAREGTVARSIGTDDSSIRHDMNSVGRGT